MLENLNAKEQEVLEVIRTVIDPEVNINIVDMGLIYDVKVDEEAKSVHVNLTLSARGCPVGDTIINQVRIVIQNIFPEYAKVDVELVWEPQWTPEMITDAGRAMLS